MAKAKREKIMMKSTESHHFYTANKNKTNTPDKLEFSKYDPVVRKHVKYVEKKLPSGKKK